MAAPAPSKVDESIVAKAVDLEEYVNQITEEKTRAALIALNPGAVAGGTTPALPSAVTAAPAVAAVPAAAVPTAAPATEPAPAPAAEPTAPVADALGDVDLSDLDLDSLTDVI